MLKPKYWNVVLFLLVKTIVFAVLIAFVDNRYHSYITDLHRGGGLMEKTISYLGYILIFGIIPTVIIFSAPIYFSFSIKRPLFFIASILVIFTLDYLFYSKMDGFVNDLERYYFWICNFLCFSILFYLPVKRKFMQKVEQ
jgi:hypothetical protein